MVLINDILRHEFNIKNDFFNPISGTNLLSYIILFIIIFWCYKYVEKYNFKIIGFIYIFLIIYLVIIIINYKMSTNIYITDKYISPENIYDKLKTGDLVFFRCYEYDSISTGLYLAVPLLQKKNYFTHIGLIYKDNKNKLYIIESNADKKFCSFSKKLKSGFQMIEFINRINNAYPYRIHIVQNNLYQFINNDKLNESIIKYKNYNFLQNGVYCIKLIVNILIENGVLKDECIFPYLIDDLIDSKNYNVPIVFNEPILIKNLE